MLTLLCLWLSGAASAAPADAVQAARAHLLGAADARTSGAPDADGVDGPELLGEAHAWSGGTLVRFRQQLHGLPVHGPTVVVSVAGSGEIRRAAGRPVRRTQPRSPVLDEAEAVERARAVGAVFGGGELWAPRAKLAWYAPGDVEPRLTWAVDVSTAWPTGTWRTWIDATTGEVVATDKTSRSARARAYPTSPALSDPVEVVLAGLPDGSVVLDGEHVWVESCDDFTVSADPLGPMACHAASHHALADDDGDFYFPPTPERLDDPQAEVQVYHHVDRVAAFLAHRYGFRHPRSMRGVVNFEMLNAFFGDFDGDGEPDLCFGQDPETGVDFAYDADVVYHEYGHSVVARMANLSWLQADSWGMDWVAGSINEGYADVLSMVLTGDPLLAEYAGGALGRDSIRDLSVPRRCPDDLPGEVHADGQVLGHLAWNLIEAIGPERAHDLFFGALPFWGRDVSWPAVGASLLDSAADLLEAGALDGAAHDTVVSELERANLLDCGRAVVLEDGDDLTLYMINLGLQGDFARIPMGVQVAVDVPDGATHVRLEVVDAYATEGMGWTVSARVGAHVAHEVTTVTGLGLALATPRTFDVSVDGEGPGELTLPVDGDPPLLAGDRVYFALASRNTGELPPLSMHNGVVVVRAHVDTDAAEVPWELRGGCGCTTGRPWSLGLVLWPLVIAVVRRSRR